MPVSQRGFVQATVSATGSQSLAWPVGTVAGDLAIVEAGHAELGAGPSGAGWVYAGTSVWWRRVTSADLSAPVAVSGRLASMVVLAGASGLGRSSEQRGVKVKAGGAAFIRGWTAGYASGISPATNRLGSAVTMPDDQHLHATWLVLGSPTVEQYVSIASDGDVDGYRSFEVVPRGAPAAPTLLAPAAGADVNSAAPIVLSWLPAATGEGAVPDGWRVSIRAVGATTWQWVNGSGALVATETSVASSATSVSIPAGTLVAGQAYEWRDSTSELGLWSPYSLAQTFTPRALPVVTSVTVSSPLNKLTPTVSWTTTLSNPPQTAETVSFSAAGEALGEPIIAQSTATSYTSPPLAWVNGQTVTATVSVQQAGGLWSAPVSKDFAVTWTPPAAPSMVTPTDGSPFRIVVSGIASGLGLQVESSIDNATWTPVTDKATPGALADIDVPLAPYGIPVRYRARTYTMLDGVKLWSAWTSASPISSTDQTCYLVSDDGSQWLAVTVVTDGAAEVVQGRTVSYGLGASRARVDSTPTAGTRGSMTLRAYSAAERAALVEWLTTRTVWWMRWHPEANDTYGSPPIHVPPVRMALSSPLSYERMVQIPLSWRVLTVDWVEQ